ncbi:hypothetical protein Agabi119p4_2244 [Agaricus bisporus var. burnettii]|uniref:Uncharacterized protein n=1 Tax=Agaricus bisporus var. burnettii TaxID=192524 RepID=A0A8H7KK30_AGABI|nr:hypothetical protein Agabi119p4_2244 [Agaricus bisporus var. burnettii]
MFSIASYLAEKISSFIGWRSASTVLSSVPVAGKTIKEGEGVELDERVGVEEEVSNLKKLLEEARARESENVRKIEELEMLREEIEGLREELEEERKRKEKEQENVGVQEKEQSLYSLEDSPIGTRSESEVVDLVKLLNQEILHLSEIIVKAFENVARPARSEDEAMPEELKEAFACVEEILGYRMVDLLRKNVDDDGETVRIALKTSMAAYTHWIISSWYFENPEDEHLLSEIYARVREAEEQMVSGRWRALTRIHLQRMLAAEPDLTIYMVDAFVNIILTAGWHNDATTLQEYLIETFGDRISRLLNTAKRLNKMIGEEIMHCDLEALYIAPEVTFNNITMEIAGGVGDEEKMVLCTTDLGLVKAEKRLGKVGEWDEAVLLRPKVVFDV